MFGNLKGTYFIESMVSIFFALFSVVDVKLCV